MHPRRALPAHATALLVVPWDDAVIDQVGYDPRAAYVERFWLGILGPSATWLLRLLVDRLDGAPAGYDLDMGECASALGLGGAGGAFPRTLARCCQFGAARFFAPVTFEVRRKLPPLSRRQIARLPAPLQADHARWVDEPPRLAPDDLIERARQLALSLVQLGEDAAGTERQLQRWRFHPSMAGEATAWALDRQANRLRTTPTADPPTGAATGGGAGTAGGVEAPGGAGNLTDALSGSAGHAAHAAPTDTAPTDRANEPTAHGAPSDAGDRTTAPAGATASGTRTHAPTGAAAPATHTNTASRTHAPTGPTTPATHTNTASRTAGTAPTVDVPP